MHQVCKIIASGEVGAPLYPLESIANQKFANLIISVIVNLAVILFEVGGFSCLRSLGVIPYEVLSKESGNLGSCAQPLLDSLEYIFCGCFSVYGVQEFRSFSLRGFV